MVCWLCLLDEKAADAAEDASKSRGAALGPDWTDILPIHGSKQVYMAAMLFSL